MAVTKGIMKSFGNTGSVLFCTTVIYALLMIFIDDKVLDIHLHDTYFVINLKIVLTASAIIFLLLFLIHISVKRVVLSKLLSRIHEFVSVICVSVIIFFAFSKRFLIVGEGATADVVSNISEIVTAYNILGYLLMIFIAAQLLYIFNILVGVIRRLSGKLDR